MTHDSTRRHSRPAAEPATYGAKKKPNRPTPPDRAPRMNSYSALARLAAEHHPDKSAWMRRSDDQDPLRAPISADRTIRAKRRHRWVRRSGDLNVGSPHYLRTRAPARETPPPGCAPLATRNGGNPPYLRFRSLCAEDPPGTSAWWSPPLATWTLATRVSCAPRRRAPEIPPPGEADLDDPDLLRAPLPRTGRSVSKVGIAGCAAPVT